jgi:hypothetical protein
MLKSILNLEGAQQLSKKEQKEINGGRLNPAGNQENCVCVLIQWGTIQDPSTHDGVGMLISTDWSPKAIPVGFAPIYPVPACCKPELG